MVAYSQSSFENATLSNRVGDHASVEMRRKKPKHLDDSHGVRNQSFGDIHWMDMDSGYDQDFLRCNGQGFGIKLCLKLGMAADTIEMEIEMKDTVAWV